MTAQQTFVLVGAGLAGAKTAEALRTEGFGGRVVLMGEEAERLYDHPPLSKDYLQGKSEKEKVYIGRVWQSWPTYVRVSIVTQEEMNKFKTAFLQVMA